MKGLIVGLLLGAVVGTAGGFAAGIFWYPFLLPPPPLHEELTGTETRRVIATGTFIQADPRDPIHYGMGRVSVYQDLVQLGADFEVGPGPKFHVYLVPEADVQPYTRVEETMFVDLGRLKAFRGSQSYPIPDGVDLSEYRSVVIWCEQLNMLISPASLRPVDPFSPS